MLDLHAPRLDPEHGQRLTDAEYDSDFDERYEQIYDHDSWKFERRQHFEEQNSPSHDAMRRGEWAEALRLLEDRREGLRTAAEQDRRQRTVFHRVRVVEKPFTPYLQWELCSLRIKAEYDEVIRVVDAATVSPLESGGLLPEVVVLGGQSLYEVVYTDDGVPDGAIRFTNPDLVKSWEDFVRALFHSGEDVVRYVEREVALLPPPRL